MADRPTTGYIPPNLSEDGGVFGGMLKLRNVVEAGIFFATSIFLTKPLTLIFPSVVATSAGLILGIVIGLVALLGIGGEPLTIFVLNVITYRNTSGYIPIRMPMPMSVEAKSKKGGDAGKLEKGLAKLIHGKSKK